MTKFDFDVGDKMNGEIWRDVPSPMRNTYHAAARKFLPCRLNSSMNTSSARCSRPAAVLAAISTKSTRPISHCSARKNGATCQAEKSHECLDRISGQLR